MKKLTGFIVFLLFAVGIFILANREYVADNKPAEIEKELMKFLDNRPTRVQKVEILKMQQIGESNTSVAVYLINGDKKGLAKLEKTWLNKVKIIHTGSGPGTISYRGIKTNKGDYGVLYGVNPGLSIHTVRINNSDVGYPEDIDVSKEEAILVVNKLTTDVDKALGAELVFLDKEGKDITREQYSSH